MDMSLVLSRRIGESILIGPDIVVKIAGITATQVRIAIDAPPEVKILREELTERDHTWGEGEVQ
jgi:carbon storage regulator